MSASSETTQSTPPTIEHPERTQNGPSDFLDDEDPIPGNNHQDHGNGDGDGPNCEDAPGADADADNEFALHTNQGTSSYRNSLAEVRSGGWRMMQRSLEPDEEDGTVSIDPPEELEHFVSPRARSKARRSFFMKRLRRKQEPHSFIIEESDEYSNLYEELGLPERPKQHHYTYPILHSQRTKLLFVAILALGIIIGVIVGTNSSKWQGELIEVVKVEEDKLHEKLHNIDKSQVNVDSSSSPASSNITIYNKHNASQMYEYTAITYKPLFFDRNKGWRGKSYDEAILFCAGKNRVLCPYKAYCPLGPMSTPMGGAVDDLTSWSPLVDYDNGWVQIGTKDPCTEWKNIYEEPPTWGLNAEQSDMITQRLMCCLPHDLEGGESASNQISETAVAADDASSNLDQYVDDKFKPCWYDRSTGWSGESYSDALQFCSSQSMTLCPYEAVCPGGIDNPPHHGKKDAPNGFSWVPLVDSTMTNEWVSVSNELVCAKYSHVYPTAPEWGLTGGEEEMTRYVACCQADLVVIDADVASGDANSQVTTSTSTTESSIVSSSPETDEMLQLSYQNHNDKYHSKWFDRSDGWTGLTYTDAKNFCAATVGYQKEPMELCPIEAYCSHEWKDLVFQGVRDDPEGDARGSWSPFINVENGWIKVGSINPCAVYNDVYNDFPPWGLTGEGSEPITRNIMCCTNMRSNANVDSASTMEPIIDTMSSTNSPSIEMTLHPTVYPTLGPIAGPTTAPTASSTESPTEGPSESPTEGPTDSPTVTTLQPTNKPSIDKLLVSTFRTVNTTYTPKWFDRESNWKGQSYFDAIEFCATMGSSVPCPYEAYCPLGPGIHLFGGAKDISTSWAALIDIPNGWVQIGSENTCELYNTLYPQPPLWGLNGADNEEITRRVLCCNDKFITEAAETALEIQPPPYTTPTKLERNILDEFHPVWFERKHGYDGTTHSESQEFCKHIGNMELCPIEAYCVDNGTSSTKSLFYGRDPFQNEQWAPIADRSNSSNDWIFIGTLDGISTCTTYFDKYGVTAPWENDSSQPAKKEHILCCQSSLDVQSKSSPDETESIEKVMSDTLHPTWLDRSHGWKGGSHSEALLFCNEYGGRELCPYVAYCPYGKGQAVMRGHAIDFNSEGEQWAPVRSGTENTWVQIGQKYNNIATTCMSHEDLEGMKPTWGKSSENAILKKYIMCCKKVEGG